MCPDHITAAICPLHPDRRHELPLHGALGETQRLELGCGLADTERSMAEQQGLDREDRIS